MKYKIVFAFILLFLTALIAASFFFMDKEEKPTLKILTYSSFAGVYGPGRYLKEKFETFCACRLQWFLAEDSTALLQRLSIIPNIDLVIGWDQITLKSAENRPWENLSPLREEFINTKKHPVLKSKLFLNSRFLPIDWAPVGFLYKKKSLSRINSLKSLPEIEGRISFPEPRTSILGLQWYYWIYEVFKGDEKQISGFLKRLKGKVYGPVFSWSMAYGFFQKDKTDMGLSYLSSLLHHQKEEPEKPYFFSRFKEGHPYQVEYLSIALNSQNKETALKFAKFLLSKEAQQILLEKHYMFPSTKEMSAHKLLKQNAIQAISYDYLDSFLSKKKELLSLWRESLY